MNAKPVTVTIRDWTIRCVAALPLLAGCAHNPEFSGAEQRAMASPPGFLTGPMALLLTNDRSYNAEIVFETKTTWGSTQTIVGNFTATGTKLAFQPELSKASRKYTQGRMVFVWDTAQASGYALNDALQGYAPYWGIAQFTNVIVSKQGTAPQRIAAHECAEESAMVFGNDSSTNLLRVWRAADLRGTPLRIYDATNSSVLTFSKIQFGTPAEFLTSPEGFTKYESPDALVTELIARQHNLVRRPDSSFGYPANLDRPSQPGRPY